MVNVRRRMGRRMIGDILTRSARMGDSTKRLFRQQSVTRRPEGFGYGSIGRPSKIVNSGAQALSWKG